MRPDHHERHSRPGVVANLNSQKTADQELIAGMSPRLARSAVSLFDNHSHETASGTLVRIGDRVLVATAKHVIPRKPCGRLAVLGGNPTDLKEGVLGVVRSGVSRTADVGYLEIDGAVALSYLDRSPVPLCMLSIDPPPSEDHRLLTVVGAPSCLTKQSPGCIEIGQISYTSRVLDQSSSVVGQVDPPVRSNVDLLLDYPHEGTGRIDSSVWNSMSAPAPPGMSGAGIWDCGLDDLGLWSPDRARLVGIQSAWHAQKRYIRGAVVRWWITLIHHDYPELRGEVAKTFPRLSSSNV